MAQIIEGDTSLYKSAIFGEPDWRTLEFLSNQYNNVSQFVTNTSSNFFSAAKDMYEKVSGSTAMRTARAAAKKITSMWDKDEIRELKVIEDIQFAKPTMQRWIMAAPYVRDMYHKQRIDGYSGDYTDLYPNDIGDAHYDYRRAMNGIVIEHDDKLISNTYHDDLQDERELTIEEQVDILNTWDNVENLIRYGKIDPTSKWMAEL